MGGGLLFPDINLFDPGFSFPGFFRNFIKQKQP